MSSTLPPSWPTARAWKTAFAANQAFAARCEHLHEQGVASGAVLEALFLVAYDHAASALGGDQQWSRYMNMHWFGADGLRSLPGQGASTIPPDWREMFDIERDGHSAYSALWEVRDDCLRDGFEHAHIADALLRRALTEIGACSESGQRYWFRQFAEIGEKAAGRARPPAA